MALVQKRLFGPVAAVTSPTDTSAGRYLVPSGTTAIIKQVIICNTDSSSRTARVAVGTTATAANRIISDISLAANETVTFNCNLVMAAGEKLYLVGSSTAITFTVNGIEEV